MLHDERGIYIYCPRVQVQIRSKLALHAFLTFAPLCTTLCCTSKGQRSLDLIYRAFHTEAVHRKNSYATSYETGYNNCGVS